MVLIDGIGIGGYRSFGREVQKIGPLSKVSFLAGPNNCGKSNVLRFLAEHYDTVVRDFALHRPDKELDAHLGDGDPGWSVAFALKLEGRNHDRLLKRLRKIDKTVNPDWIDQALATHGLTGDDNVAWFRYRANDVESNLELDPSLVTELADNESINPRCWRSLYHDLAPRRKSTGTLKDDWIPTVLKMLSPGGKKEVPPVKLIPAIREVRASERESKDFSGAGLIDKLARLESPEHNEQELREQFDSISSFLQTVTGNQTATLTIPHTRKTINVRINGKVLPLESLGTGVHEVIILAAAATVLDRHVICIEEPEIHLHPVLQKKLVRYLANNTNNQYIIATHSAHLLDTPNASVFHVRLEDGATVVRPADTPRHKASLCFELGYRASDILQANCVIWVEGPSDRIYLRHWIHAIDPELEEGLHYSIMFYGGRLLSHLSADDPDVEDFISLRRLNRHIAVVMDSDREKSGKRINDTKTRVRKEFDKAPGFAWVTTGREIENYIAEPLLTEALSKTDPEFSCLAYAGQFGHALHYKTNRGQLRKHADKVAVARTVADLEPDLDVLDLKRQVRKLVRFIREANS